MSERNQLNELLERCEEIGAFGDYDYSWWEFKSWHDPEARIYYWFEDSGCSCNHFMMDVDSISELSVGRKEELSNAIREYENDNYEGLAEFKTALRNHKGSQ